MKHVANIQRFFRLTTKRGKKLSVSFQIILNFFGGSWSFDYYCRRISSLFTINVMLMKKREVDYHVVRMHNMQGKSLIHFPFSHEFICWLSGSSAERCFSGRLSEVILRLLRIGKFVPYVFWGLSQSLGRKFGVALAELSATLAKIVNALGKISATLRLNSLENWSKTQCFRLLK